MPSSTVDRILEAALGAFRVHGYAGASMSAVRREAGVSNGSLYHHFPSRADLAARLLLDGMADCQQQVIEVLAAASIAQGGVREVVERQLAWVEDHVDLSRLLYGDLPDDVFVAAEPCFSLGNRAYVKVVSAWLHNQAECGALRELPFGVAHALWLGPTQEFSRHWLHGRSRATPRRVASELANGAWRALAAP